MNLFKSLTHRPFALMWSGQTISRFGDSLHRLAVMWWVLEKTGSAAQMGLVTFFGLTPMLIFLLIGGVLVDRFPRLRVMFLSDVFSGVVVSGLALLAYLQLLEIWMLYLGVFLFGFVEAFFYPAYAAAIPEITPKELLPSANSLTDLSRRLMGIIGPALAAVLVAAGGTPLALALDGASFFISATCLLFIPQNNSAQEKTANTKNVFAELREGFQLVFSSPWLWITIAIFGVINVTDNGPFAVALPLLIKKDWQGEVSALGLIQTAFSVGSVLSAMWLGRYVKLRRRGLLAYLSTFVTGLCIFTIGLPITLWGIGVAAFVRGASVACFGLVWTNTVQELVPPEKLGRVFSIDALGSFVLMPIGFAAVGVLADAYGAPSVFSGGGLLTMLLALLALIHPAIRNLD